MPENTGDNRQRKAPNFNWETQWESFRDAYKSQPIAKSRPGIPQALKESHREVLRKQTLDFIKTNLPNALDNPKRYSEFVNRLGYSLANVPAFHTVESITLEDEKLCINEIPVDQEENDTKPEVE